MWVFGYGSLMWNPAFPFVTRSNARLSGYHRALCIRSTHYRGTLRQPGLVFGLDRGGVCDGVAFEVADEDAARVLVTLRRRELIYGVYREVRVPVSLGGAQSADERRTVEAVTYVAERAHPSYAGNAPVARQVQALRGAHGIAGSNLAYLFNTLAHLRELGLRDRDIERMGVRASAFALPGPMTLKPNAARVKSLSHAWRSKRHSRIRLDRAEQTRFQHRAFLWTAPDPQPAK